jgi:6-phosphogluconolactonase/glucosamine-6-phosphate isomerase/deaminase
MTTANAIEVRHGPKPIVAARSAADHVALLVSDAVEARGGATVALSGGTSPSSLFDALSTIDLPWDRVEIFQVDERLVRHSSPERNWSTISERLVQPTGAKGRPMPVAEMPFRFDVVHLGLGLDGHTASWPTGHPVLGARGGLALIGDFNGTRRITVTPPVVNAARNVVWFVPGDAKRSVIDRLIGGDRSLPASVVRARRSVLFGSGDD